MFREDNFGSFATWTVFSKKKSDYFSAFISITITAIRGRCMCSERLVAAVWPEAPPHLWFLTKKAAYSTSNCNSKFLYYDFSYLFLFVAVQDKINTWYYMIIREWLITAPSFLDEVAGCSLFLFFEKEKRKCSILSKNQEGKHQKTLKNFLNFIRKV